MSFDRFAGSVGKKFRGWVCPQSPQPFAASGSVSRCGPYGIIALLSPLALGLLVPCISRAASASAPTTLEEVIVTAERIETSAQKTPISIQVFSQADLLTKGIVDAQSLANADSSLSFDTGNGAGFVVMRGITGGYGFGGPGIIAPSVPLSFDGFYYNMNIIFNDAIYDVKRIEVLRGPQGTLFGRNSTGGLIHIVTNEPGKKFGGYGQLTFGNYNRVEAQGALNLPLSKKLQMRIAFFSARHSGYHNMAYGLGQADDRDANSGRLKVAYEPTNYLKVLLSFQLTHVGGAGPTDNVIVLPHNAQGFPTHATIPLSSLDTRVYNLAMPNKMRVTDKLTQWRVIDTGLPWGMTLTYLGGYDQLVHRAETPLLGIDAMAYGLPPTIVGEETMNPTTQDDEIRLASAPDRTITWQGGVFYWRSDIGHNGTNFLDAGQPTAPAFVEELYNDSQRSIAGYGQADWHMGASTLSAGLRYTDDHIARTDLTSPQDGIFPARQAISEREWTWHLGETWNITKHNMVYATFNTGYSAGGYNLNVPCNCTGGPLLPTTIEPYAPEFVKTYEIGSKNKFFNNHVLLNVDGFYTNFTDQQLQASNAGGVYTLNAKKANIYGVEAEGAAVGELGRFNLNATWLHARFDNQLLTNAIGETFNIGGNRLVQAPSLSITATVEHAFDVGSGTLTPRVDTKFQTGQYYDFYNVPDSYQPAHEITDVHLIYAPNVGRWSIDLWMRNVANTVAIADESESFAPPLILPGTYNVGFQPPRTFGVTILDRF